MAFAVKSDGQHAVLTSYPVPSATGYSIRLAVAPCKNKVCKIFVQLTHGNKVLSELPLEWSAGTPTIAQEMVGRWYGAGDPLDSDAQWQSWGVGGMGEEEFVSVVARPVTLASGVHGLAIHQTSGVDDHVHRHHAVYAVAKDRLVLAWQKTEGPGPTWSTLIDAVDENKVSRLTYVEALQTGDKQLPDRLTIITLGWNVSTGKLQAQSRPHVPMYYIVIHPFNDLLSARSFGNSHKKCLGSNFSLLEQKDFKIKELPAKYTFAAVTQSRIFAEQAKNKLGSCLPATAEVKVEIY